MSDLLLSEIAARTDGRLFGDDCQISALRRVREARLGHLGIILRPQELRYLPHCKGSGVLLGESDAADFLDTLTCSAIVVAQPFPAIFAILNMLARPDCDVIIGEQCQIDPSVILKPGTRIGDRVKIGAHCVIGGDGFVFHNTESGQVRMPHYHGVDIGDDVELGSHVCVDQGMLAPTRIGARTKIDNLVQVAHDVVIGSDCIVVAQVGIAGHARIGSHVSIGGQAGVAPYISVGDYAQISARSAVFSDMSEREIWSGSPAMPHMDFLRSSSALKKLARTRHGSSKTRTQTSHGLSGNFKDSAASIPLLDDRPSA